MGQTLSEPVVDKHSSAGGDERYIYGASAMQGWRISMEDAHTTVLKIGPDGESAFFAVYDGHGGQTAAKFAGAMLHEYIIKDENYSKGDYAAAIKRGYLEMDSALRQFPEMENDSSGCTAISVLLTKDGAAFCGNAGDSRSIISTKGRAIALSHDHKPTDDIEFNRITSGGGYVEFGRVNGNLALSRALGDFEFKNNRTLSAEKQIVTAQPDVIKHALSVDDEFIVVACDGIWDCMTNQQVVQFVHAKIAEGKKLDQVCEEMMDRCLASESDLGGVGCDNMTVIVLGILNGKTEDEWYEHVKQVAEETGMKSSPKIDRSSGSEAAEDGAAIINSILARAAAHHDIDDEHNDEQQPENATSSSKEHAAATDIGIDAGADVPDIARVVHAENAAKAADVKPADDSDAAVVKPAEEAADGSRGEGNDRKPEKPAEH
ncbi:phosphatase 2C-like domain-containing protein [Coemansia spiralis]|nr:phosphatase 2C-like domain-containing protein [Coemansia spiralis]